MDQMLEHLVHSLPEKNHASLNTSKLLMRGKGICRREAGERWESSGDKWERGWREDGVMGERWDSSEREVGERWETVGRVAGER